MKTKITLLVLLFTLNVIGVQGQIKQVKTTPVHKTNKIYAKPVAKKSQKIKGTLVAPNGKHYFFTEKRYFRYSDENGLEKIANTKPNWSGIPDDVDGVFVSSKNKKAYFFKGSTYNRWDFKDGNDNPELKISRFWKGVPNDIDAVTNHTNGKVYFFKGDTYYRYDTKLKKVDKTALISKNWKGVPNNVAAALLHENGKVYFFKDDMYYRYNIKSGRVDKTAKIGATGWKELDFDKKNFTKKIVNDNIRNTKLKITLTNMRVLKTDKKHDKVEVYLNQNLHYRANGKNIPDNEKERFFGTYKTETHHRNQQLEKTGELRSLIYHEWKRFRTSARDYNVYSQINNILVYPLNSKEIADKNAYIEIRTNLSAWYLDELGSDNIIANNLPIKVKVNEVLKYLLDPNAIPSDYFNSDGYHYSGAEGSFMPFKIANDRSALDGYVEHSNSGITVRTYYHFELIP